MEKRIVFATGNENKMREIRMILQDLGMPVCSMHEAGINPEIIENGKSFEENAAIKAETVYKELMRLGREDPAQYGQYAGAIVLADDSGLEIDHLHREPGIYSARYLGEDTPYSVKNRILLERMEGVAEEERSARFVCAVAAVVGEQTLIVRETMEGRVAYAPAGENGFGYDPIFYLPEYGCTSAELPPEQKNAISHRGKALLSMREQLVRVCGRNEA